LTRRAALQGFGLGIVGIGCTQTATTTTRPDDPSSGTPADGGTPGSGAIGIDSTEAVLGSPAPKLSPKELLAGIEHLVVLVMEHRSFDHVLGALSLDATYPGRATVDGLKGTESTPGPSGEDVTVFKMTNFTPEDPPHNWGASHVQFNDGKNDGFVTVYP